MKKENDDDPEPARLAASPQDYERLKLEKRQIQPWEDGQRVEPGAPYLEWWYFIGDEVHQAAGTGYHDHNWMNLEMAHLLDHWWWARGGVGPYTFIMAHLAAAKKYGYTPFDLYMFARDGKLIRYPGGYLRFSAAVSLNCYRGGLLVEHDEKAGVFEQMYFARTIHEESLEHDAAR